MVKSTKALYLHGLTWWPWATVSVFITVIVILNSTDSRPGSSLCFICPQRPLRHQHLEPRSAPGQRRQECFRRWTRCFAKPESGRLREQRGYGRDILIKTYRIGGFACSFTSVNACVNSYVVHTFSLHSSWRSCQRGALSHIYALIQPLNYSCPFTSILCQIIFTFPSVRTPTSWHVPCSNDLLARSTCAVLSGNAPLQQKCAGAKTWGCSSRCRYHRRGLASERCTSI